jgi:parallel beta-helix repeat protein
MEPSVGGGLRARCLVGLLLGVSLILSSIFISRAAATGSFSHPLGGARGPISIEGNAGFSPVNGVVAGNGTSADPYIIEGWNVSAPRDGVAIWIRNTTAHFVLRNSTVEGPIYEYDGIHLTNVTHGRIDGGYWTWMTRNGLILEEVQDLAIVGCVCVLSANWAVSGRSLVNVSLLRSRVSDNTYPIRIEGGHNLTFEGNTIRDNHGVFNAAGIELSQVADSTITGNTIGSESVGVSLDRTARVVVEDNDFLPYAYGAIGADRSVGDVYRGNRISDQRSVGIDLSNSENLTISGNSIVRSSGIRVREGRGIGFYGNTISGGGLSFTGFSLDHFASHTIGADNLVNGLPVLYAVNARGLDIVGGAYGQVILANVSQSRIASLTFRDTVGPQLRFVEGIEIDSVTIVRPTGIGIDAFQARDLTIRNARLEDSTDIAIQVSGGANVHLEEVIARGGIALSGISGGTVRNSSTGQSIGLFVWGIRADAVRDFVLAGNSILRANYGITVSEAANVSIRDNRIDGDGFYSEVGVDVQATRDVKIQANGIAGNQIGVRLANVTGADVYRNVVGSSGVYAMDDRGSGNTWDHGYPEGGNYWGNYMGWDDCEGPGQDVCPDVPVNDLVDGIGDQPYMIDSDSGDRFPLMNVDLQDELPVPMAIVVAPGPPIDPGDTVVIRLDGSYDRDGPIVACEWDFGDGTNGSEAPCPASVSHVYVTSGSHPFTFTVIDNRGGRGTLLQSIYVEGSPFRIYVRPDEFRLPVPYWGWSENVSEPFEYGQKGFLLRLRGGVEIELLLAGGYNGSRATIFVDTDDDPNAREDEAYLNATAYRAFETILRERSDTTMDVPPSYRTLSGHLAVVFVLRYGSIEVLQKFVVIVSEVHHRFWLLALDGLRSDFAPLDTMFEQMVAGFEITRPAPSSAPAGVPILLDPPRVAAVSVTAIGIASVLGVLLLRRRSGALPRRPGRR